MKKKYVGAIIAIVVILGAWWAIQDKKSQGNIICGLDACAPSGRLMSIENYVRANIRELSPVKESLGGSFYVTEIEAHGGAGTVRYEDGHNAYIADFTYSAGETDGIVIDSFVVRK